MTNRRRNSAESGADSAGTEMSWVIICASRLPSWIWQKTMSPFLRAWMLRNGKKWHTSPLHTWGQSEWSVAWYCTSIPCWSFCLSTRFRDARRLHEFSRRLQSNSAVGAISWHGNICGALGNRGGGSGSGAVSPLDTPGAGSPLDAAPLALSINADAAVSVTASHDHSERSHWDGAAVGEYPSCHDPPHRSD